MKNVKKIMAIFITTMIIMSLSACGNKNNSKAETSTTSKVESITTDGFKSAVTTTTEKTVSETETSDTEIEALNIEDFLPQVSDKLIDIKAVDINCKTKGNIPTNEVDSQLLKHEYTYSMNETKTYLHSFTENLNDDTLSLKYEKYQVSEDDMITPYVKSDTSWEKGKTEFLSSGNLTTLSMKNIGVIKLLLSNDNTEIFESAIFEKTDTDYILSVNWTDFKSDSLDIRDALKGLVINNNIDPLLNIELANINGDIKYTFDKNFMLTSIVANITDINDINYFAIKTEMSFKNWNNVNIKLPNAVLDIKSDDILVSERDNV